MSDHKIRCGDTVLHRPTRETWEVAYADYARDELAWLGWPPGVAKLSDCELLESVGDDEHARRVAAWLDKPQLADDHRVGPIRRLYRPEAP
jgi:hypothetical protein